MKKPTYTQNWKAYNAAQMNEKNYVRRLLRGLCDGIVEPVQTKGRPRHLLSDLVFASVMKIYCGMSGRRTACELEECAKEGFLSRVPHPNAISRTLVKEEITPLLQALILESATPLADIEHDFAADSTGFSTHTYDRWFKEKHGQKDKKKAKPRKYGDKDKKHWVKAHAITGVETNIVTHVILGGSDSLQLEELLLITADRFDLKEVSADKAYLSRKNLLTISALGAVPYICFKENSVGRRGNTTGDKLWNMMYGYFMYKNEEFMDHYHKRSNVETTFHMVKAKFGTFVRSKSQVAQENEVLCKFICHNLAVLVSSIFELGIEAKFWGKDNGVSTTAPSTNTDAPQSSAPEVNPGTGDDLCSAPTTSP